MTATPTAAPPPPHMDWSAASQSRATIDVSPHVGWATGIAVGVARAYRFTPGGQEEDELIGTALFRLVELSHRYDPAREVVKTDCGALFKGFCRRTLMTECQREARRVRNGGTYRTREETAGVTLSVEALSSHCLDDGTQWEPADHRAADAGYAFADD